MYKKFTKVVPKTQKLLCALYPGCLLLIDVNSVLLVWPFFPTCLLLSPLSCSLIFLFFSQHLRVSWRPCTSFSVSECVFLNKDVFLPKHNMMIKIRKFPLIQWSYLIHTPYSYFNGGSYNVFYGIFSSVKILIKNHIEFSCPDFSLF